MSKEFMKNSCFYIAGPDGIGKTTYIKSIEKDLNSNNKSTHHIWIRSPKILSKPLMAICRLVGLTTYKTINGIKYGQHHFYKSKFVSWLFPKLQLIDFKIKWNAQKKSIQKDDVILFDRFSLDTLADLMVSTQNYNLHKSKVGKAFINLLPDNLKLIILEVEEDVIRKRKLDTLYDKNLAAKIKVYKILSNDLNLKVIDNNRDIKSVKKEIKEFINV